MTKNIGYTDESVTKIELQDSSSSGILWGSIGEGIVPIFEEQAVRVERGYTLQEWIEMDSVEKAMAIAIRRIDIAMKNIQHEAEIKKSKKRR